jgi:hypothetical protein
MELGLLSADISTSTSIQQEICAAEAQSSASLLEHTLSTSVARLSACQPLRQDPDGIPMDTTFDIDQATFDAVHTAGRLCFSARRA